MYPVDSGGAHAQLAFIDRLQNEQEIDLLIRPENIDEKEIPSFRARFPGIRLLPAGYRPAGPGQKIVAFFRKIGKKIAGKDPSYKLRRHGFLNALIRTRPDVLKEIKRIARAKKYDVIQVEHSINMGLVELLPSGPKKIFVHHEIAHTRVYSDMLSKGMDKIAAGKNAGIVWQLEKKWLDRYDGIITLSPEDAALLKEKGITRPMQVAEPFALFPDELNKIYNASLAPVLLFAGGESHYPNKEGLGWFLRDVFPLVRKEQPECSIRITGLWSESFREEFAGDPGIRFLGFVDSLDELYRDSLLIVPVRIGSGVRIKVITALAHGLPVVGTILGVSGIPGLVQHENVLLATDEKSFASHLILLLRDEACRMRLSEQGFALAKRGYGEAGFANARTRFYYEVPGGGNEAAQQ